MKLIHRIGYFSIGLFFGIVILMFFLGGKRASCDYSPNARTLKNIRIKERVFSDEALSYFSNREIDTAWVSTILNDGKVHFGESDTDAKPCAVYSVSGKMESSKLQLHIQNCDSTAIIQRVELVE